MISIRPSRASIAFALALLLSCPPPAAALVVTCTNCGTEWTQLANNLQLIDQLAKQVQLVEEAIKRHQNMVLNTTGLEEQSFGAPLAELRKVTELLATAKSLSFASGDLDAQFAAKYRDYQGYAAEQLDEAGLAAKYQQWSEDTNAAVLGTLKAAQLQSGQMEGDEQALFTALEQQAMTAEGRMQALQLANEIALASARQIQKLRQLMLVQLQLQANYIQTAMDRKVREDADYERFLKSGRDTIKAADGKGF